MFTSILPVKMPCNRPLFTTSRLKATTPPPPTPTPVSSSAALANSSKENSTTPMTSSSLPTSLSNTVNRTPPSRSSSHELALRLSTGALSQTALSTCRFTSVLTSAEAAFKAAGNVSTTTYGSDLAAAMVHPRALLGGAVKPGLTCALVNATLTPDTLAASPSSSPFSSSSSMLVLAALSVLSGIFWRVTPVSMAVRSIAFKSKNLSWGKKGKFPAAADVDARVDGEEGGTSPAGPLVKGGAVGRFPGFGVGNTLNRPSTGLWSEVAKAWHPSNEWQLTCSSKCAWLFHRMRSQ
mmetsp:Transcript_60463/g.121341  ORF Transcript_60463/g.121341 Transcript_60463/m.121341 type:complete len:294 (-) Transcript_60463:1160-2041(-)